MAPKAKQTIKLEELVEVGKATLKDPDVDLYGSDDVNVVVAAHLSFFLAIAPRTRRLNPVSVAQVAKELFKSGGREAQLYGQSIAKAFGHCMLAGGKAITGQKLSKEVWSVWRAADPDAAKGEVKTEPPVAAGCKRERGSSPPRPTKFLQTCLSSPSQISASYSGGASSSSCASRMKVMGAHHEQTSRRHRRKLPP